MERSHYDQLLICTAVALLAIVAFSCCVAAEFKKAKVKDMKLDGSLCSLPRSSAFRLGITALVCLSIVQITGISFSKTSLRSSKMSAESRWRILSGLLLLLSWLSYGLAVILLATATSMNSGQAYGRGWMNGDCYIVQDGVYVGAAVLVVTVLGFILGYIVATRARQQPDRSCHDHEKSLPQQKKERSSIVRKDIVT